MDIQKSIVAILDRKRKSIGTGFVAGENLILTCAHVVETATSSVVDPITDLNIQVTVRFAADGFEVVAQVDAKSCSPSYEKDVALLRMDRTVRVWQWQPQNLIIDACSRVTHNLTRVEWQQYMGNSLPYQAGCSNLPIEP